eukprot:m.9651 g.9651  ORF g.9651 m.9651 type:complete len:89 (-) comp5478_c0_seq2:126-392(-)
MSTPEKPAPSRFQNPEVFKGYGTQKAVNPMYQTTASSYGALPPNLQTVPQQYHGRNQKFSSHMGQAGMSTRTGLSTAKDTSKVHSSLD